LVNRACAPWCDCGHSFDATRPDWPEAGRRREAAEEREADYVCGGLWISLVGALILLFGVSTDGVGYVWVYDDYWSESYVAVGLRGYGYLVASICLGWFGALVCVLGRPDACVSRSARCIWTGALLAIVAVFTLGVWGLLAAASLLAASIAFAIMRAIAGEIWRASSQRQLHLPIARATCREPVRSR
jgi:hypothetical protein